MLTLRARPCLGAVKPATRRAVRRSVVVRAAEMVRGRRASASARRGRRACALVFLPPWLTLIPHVPPAHTHPFLTLTPVPPHIHTQTSGSAEFEGGVGTATFRAPAAPPAPNRSSRGRPGVAAFEGGTGTAMFASR